MERQNIGVQVDMNRRKLVSLEDLTERKVRHLFSKRDCSLELLTWTSKNKKLNLDITSAKLFEANTS